MLPQRGMDGKRRASHIKTTGRETDPECGEQTWLEALKTSGVVKETPPPVSHLSGSRAHELGSIEDARVVLCPES